MSKVVQNNGISNWPHHYGSVLAHLNSNGAVKVADNVQYKLGALEIRAVMLAAMLAHLGIEEVKPDNMVDHIGTSFKNHGVDNILEVGSGDFPLAAVFSEVEREKLGVSWQAVDPSLDVDLHQKYGVKANKGDVVDFMAENMGSFDFIISFGFLREVYSCYPYLFSHKPQLERFAVLRGEAEVLKIAQGMQRMLSNNLKRAIFAAGTGTPTDYSYEKEILPDFVALDLKEEVFKRRGFQVLLWQDKISDAVRFLKYFQPQHYINNRGPGIKIMNTPNYGISPYLVVLQ